MGTFILKIHVGRHGFKESLEGEEEEGEEEEGVSFTLSCTGWGISNFNILLMCED
jgi:hypothetical protein